MEKCMYANFYRIQYKPVFMCAFVVLLIFAAEQLNCQNRSVKTTGINKKHITVDFSNNILS